MVKRSEKSTEVLIAADGQMVSHSPLQIWDWHSPCKESLVAHTTPWYPAGGRTSNLSVTMAGLLLERRSMMIYVQLLNLLKMNFKKKNEIHHWIYRELLLFCWDPFSKSKPPGPAPGLALHPWWEPLKWFRAPKKTSPDQRAAYVASS